jgi:basic membrane lipoprotein Med (substrate-binding protein (PBP1-ABC) superfamily)
MRTTLRSITHHPRISLGALIGTVAIALTALALRPHHHQTHAVYTPPVRARVYTAFTACLLTSPTGIADTRSAPVWAGMEAASTSTRAQISYLEIQGPQTAANADAYVNTLALQGCSLILTVGQAAGQGADDRAKALPHSRFITIGGPASAATNITAVTATSPTAVTAAVKALIATSAA